MLIQRISHDSWKASIPVIFILFLEDIHLLLENILTLMEITSLEDNEVLVKTSCFWDRIVFIIQKNKAEVDGIFSILYNANI